MNEWGRSSTFRDASRAGISAFIEDKNLLDSLSGSQWEAMNWEDVGEGVKIAFSSASQKLRETVSLNKDYVLAYLTDKQGYLIASSSKPDDFFYGKKGWWKETYADGKGRIYFDELVLNQGGRYLHLVAISVPVYSQTDEVLGILRVFYRTDRLIDYINRYGIGRKKIFILNNNKLLLATYPLSQDDIDYTTDFFEKLLDKFQKQKPKNYVNFIIPSSGDEAIASYSLTTHLHWSVLVVQPLSSIWKIPHKKVLTILSLSAVISFILIALLFSYFVVSTFRPFNQIIHTIDEVEKGNYNIKVDISAVGEIKFFAERLNALLERFIELVHIELQYERKDKEFNELVSALDKVAEGDLVVDVESEAVEEPLAKVDRSLSELLDKVRSLLSSNRDAVYKINYLSKDLLECCKEQTEYLNDKLPALKDIFSFIQKTLEHTKALSSSVKLLTEMVLEITTEIEKLHQNLERSWNNTTMFLGNLRDIKMRGSEVKDAIKSMETIAGQMDLLALNLAIEASKDGESNRKLISVADEIKNSAEQSGKMIQSIVNLIQNIQEDETKIVIAMERENVEMESSLKLVSTTKEVLEKNKHILPQSSAVVKETYSSANERLVITDELTKALSEVIRLNKKIDADVSELSAMESNLQNSIRVLEEVVEKYKTK
jgi:methyl-accepting chemotaxis protein